MFQTEKKHKLPKAFAKDWIALLRSGKFEKAEKIHYTPFLMENGEIVGGEAYCGMGLAYKCLGVPDVYLMGRNFVSPIFVKNSYGIEIPKGLLDIKDIIIEKNDEQGYSLPQLAYWVIQNCEFI